MKLKMIFFLLITIAINAQESKRFVYEYKMVPDINVQDSIVTNYMHLDSDQTTSYFYNATKFEMDSLLETPGKLNELIAFKRYDQNLNYEIKKNRSTNTIDYYKKFSGVAIWVPENESIKWTLLDENKKIGSWNCQKAQADYRGRTWEAWFTTEIPISDGPYKFSGLPGLIVTIKDTENQHAFELIQIKTIQQPFKGLSQMRGLKKMTREEFITKTKERKFDPQTDIVSINISGSGNLTLSTTDGNHINLDGNELKKYAGKHGQYDAEIARRLKLTNNQIELN